MSGIALVGGMEESSDVGGGAPRNVGIAFLLVAGIVCLVLMGRFLGKAASRHDRHSHK